MQFISLRLWGEAKLDSSSPSWEQFAWHISVSAPLISDLSSEIGCFRTDLGDLW